jgi:hypothetical protein
MGVEGKIRVGLGGFVIHGKMFCTSEIINDTFKDVEMEKQAHNGRSDAKKYM